MVHNRKMVEILSAITLGLLSAGTAKAATTPQLVANDGYGVRYEHNRASFYNKSASEGYANVWRNARDNWNNTGAFKWTETTNENSRTFTSSVSMNTGEWANATGMTFSRVIIDANNPAWQTGAKIYLNRYNLDLYDYTTAEKVNVATHEMGHGIGLAHNATNNKSVMWYASRDQQIVADDINGVKAIYGSSRNTETNNGDNSIINSKPTMNIDYVNNYEGNQGLSLLKKDATKIVVGTIKSSVSHSINNASGENYYTMQNMDVSKTIKGNAVNRISFTQSGNNKVNVQNSKLLKTGDHVMVALTKDGEGNWVVLNDGQGIFIANSNVRNDKSVQSFQRVSDGQIATESMLK